jgi:hypothetical protein
VFERGGVLRGGQWEGQGPAVCQLVHGGVGSAVLFLPCTSWCIGASVWPGRKTAAAAAALHTETLARLFITQHTHPICCRR